MLVYIRCKCQMVYFRISYYFFRPSILASFKFTSFSCFLSRGRSLLVVNNSLIFLLLCSKEWLNWLSGGIKTFKFFVISIRAGNSINSNKSLSRMFELVQCRCQCNFIRTAIEDKKKNPERNKKEKAEEDEAIRFYHGPRQKAWNQRLPYLRDDSCDTWLLSNQIIKNWWKTFL